MSRLPSTLPELLREIVKRGELTYLSVVPRGDCFAASYTPASGFRHGMAEHEDPVQALIDAIHACKVPQYRTPEINPEPWE
jgi:hypothetical protein